MKKQFWRSRSAILTMVMVFGFCLDVHSAVGAAADPAASVAPAPEPGSVWRQIAEWPALTGDWGGARTKLQEAGITFNIDAVQSYQGVLHGGTNKSWKYGGSMDYRFKFDLHKMGLWQGAFIDIQLEHQFGEFINGDTGTLLATNTDGAFPLPDYREVTVPEFKYTQFLSESIAVFLGKINSLDGDDNVFAGGRGKTNFMHQNFVVNPAGLRTVPYSTLGAGAAIFFPDVLAKDPAILSFMVLGANGQPNTSGFSRDFDDGQTYVVAYRQPTRFFNQSGSHTFSGTYGTKEYTLLTQDPRLILAGLIGYPVSPVQDESWSFMYNMHQYLYTESQDPTQGFGIFGRFGTADAETNPIEHFYSIGIGGKGLIDGRDNDTFGVGYFYAELSDRFGRVVDRDFGDTQGLEIFYNFEITKWLHVTPDFQIIEPSAKNVDTAYAAGLRVKIDF
ncbi:MAG: carbohydrate porin [Phycisphaerae bacterium]|nr:carbohydrate porin [Phycisphaerae bacterium]